MSNWVYGVDASFDEISEADARLMKLAGVKVFVQCLWTAAAQPPPRVTNLRNVLNVGGIAVAGYASINAHQPGNWHMEQARSGVPTDIWGALEHCFVDVELPRIEAVDIRLAVNKVHSAYGKDRAIYTSHHAWKDLVIPANPQNFTDCWLWNANWDNNPDLDFPHLPFGGWPLNKVIGEQWSGGTNIPGGFVDRNQFRDDLFGLTEPESPPDPVPPPPPTDAQYLHSVETWAQITEQFAKRNHRLTGHQDLKLKAKFLLGL